MEKLRIIQELEILSNANGTPGFEDEVVEVLREQTEQLGRQEEDSLRNFYVYPEDTSAPDDSRPTLMLDAHTDEVGFVVQAIMPNGMLRFLPLGGWIPANAAAQRVRVKAIDGTYIPGLIASKPPHFMSAGERDKALSFDDMLIDIGASSEDKAREEFGIRLGAPVVPDVAFEHLPGRGDLVIGKAFDNRIGCVALNATLRELKKMELKVRTIGAYAAQEEVGVRGAQLTARKVQPDIAICFEGAPADDSFSLPGGAPAQTVLGKGPMLRHVDVRMITNPRFQRFALDLAEEAGIPVQEAVRQGGGTNGAVIHLTGQGVPCIVIGIPVRYAHTHYGISQYSDIENAVKLAVAIASKLDRKTVDGF